LSTASIHHAKEYFISIGYLVSSYKYQESHTQTFYDSKQSRQTAKYTADNHQPFPGEFQTPSARRARDLPATLRHPADQGYSISR